MVGSPNSRLDLLSESGYPSLNHGIVPGGHQLPSMSTGRYSVISDDFVRA